VAARKLKQNRQLVLLRHAKSSWDDPLLDDFDRPLAKRGRTAGRRIAEWMIRHKIRPSLVLCSPSARTRETLDLIGGAIGPGAKVVYDKRLYLAELDDLLARVREVDSDVACLLMIGHNPGLQNFAVALASSAAKRERARLAEKFPTASLAWFSVDGGSWADIDPAKTELIKFLRPADLDG
jgi:phosphohistidine phosphatase